MPVITLPDGSQRVYEQAISVAQVAADIGAGLAKSALGGQVDGRLVDMSFVIKNDVTLAIVTAKNDEGVEIIRHSAAHLLAQAVKELFPTAQVTIGPVIDNGFYYDFDVERAFTPDDLAAIEAKMYDLAKANLPVSRKLVSRDEAIDLFKGMGEHYKAEIIADIPADETLSLYSQGDFTDLCRGPHVPSTGHLKAFKLMKVAGAYWRGDAANPMLQRIYGTAWPDKKALNVYLHRLEEAEKRDHRKWAKRLDLFHVQEEAPGMIFWHDKGLIFYRLVENYIRDLLQRYGYQEVRTPQVVDRSLWEKSGHWDKYADVMFTTQSESREYAIKPMSCPCHVQIFNQGLKSYRDLPLRMAEFGSCHRNEVSGTLHGLMRVRHFVQDDAHIFCTENQLQSEIAHLIEQVFELYETFGFDTIQVELSTRPVERVGSDEVWDKAEQALAHALDAKGLAWTEAAGEGAFYGPKIDISLRDCLERVWQCGTIQVDFSMPSRLGAHYIAEDGSKQVPVMVHRALLGSIERFLGVLLEHHGGSLPAWLSPLQVAILTIADAHADYANAVASQLKAHGVRVLTDLRNEKIGFKIRESTLGRIPYMLVIGEREMEEGAVSVRTREGEDLGSMALETFISRLDSRLSKKR